MLVSGFRPHTLTFEASFILAYQARPNVCRRVRAQPAALDCKLRERAQRREPTSLGVRRLGVKQRLDPFRSVPADIGWIPQDGYPLTPGALIRDTISHYAPCVDRIFVDPNSSGRPPENFEPGAKAGMSTAYRVGEDQVSLQCGISLWMIVRGHVWTATRAFLRGCSIGRVRSCVRPY